MGIQKEHHQLLAQFTEEYDLQAIASRLSTIIKESLVSNPSIKCREGTILVPNFVLTTRLILDFAYGSSLGKGSS